MRTKTTRKPCPGCGAATHPRPAESVCDQCQSDLALAAKVHKQAEKASVETISIPEQSHWLPHIYHAPHTFGEPDAIQRQILNLLTIIGKASTPSRHTKAVVHEWRRRQSSHGEWRTFNSPCFEVPTGTQACMQSLYEAIATATEHAYAEGHRKGRQLLIGLATGELTVDELNKRAIHNETVEAV